LETIRRNFTAPLRLRGQAGAGDRFIIPTSFSACRWAGNFHESVSREKFGWGTTMRMRIELPRGRDRCGRLSILDHRSRVIFGPVWCAGRASEATAAGYGNDGRSYFLPYGDTPPGKYKVKKLISMRRASPRAMLPF